MSFACELEIGKLRYEFERLLRELQEIRRLQSKITAGLDEQQKLVSLAVHLLENSAGEP